MKKILFLFTFIIITTSSFAGDRWYSYIKIFENNGYTIDSLYTPLSQKRNLVYSNIAPTDTISICSNELVLDPSTSDFNDSYNFFGEMKITDTNSYTVDSAIVNGYYVRNPLKPTIVDTIRISVVYSDLTANNNLPITYYSGSYWLMNYGYDTVRFCTVIYDSVKNYARKYNAASPNVVVYEKYLTPATLNDTMADGTISFKFNLTNINVGADQKVAVTTSFISGDVIPSWDTLIVNGNFKYNIFYPKYYKEDQFNYPLYSPTDFNGGGLQFLPLINGFQNMYIPMYAFNSATYPINFPSVDLKLNCTNCDTIANQIYLQGSSVYSNTLNFCSSNYIEAVGVSSTYQWYLNGSPITGATNINFQVTQSGVYKVLCTYNGISAFSKPVTVNINSANISANAMPNSICLGMPFTVNGSGGLAYTWNNGVVDGVPFIPTATATYIVTGTDGNGCSATSSVTVIVNPLPNPVITIVSSNLTTTIPYSTYQWSFNGNGIAGATNSTYFPLQNGLYSVSVTDANGCSNTSSNFNYVVTGLSETINDEIFSIYPNPTKDEIKIEFNKYTNQLCSLEILDINSKICISKSFEKNTTIDLSNLPKGNYFLKIKNKDEEFIRKITKE